MCWVKKTCQGRTKRIAKLWHNRLIERKTIYASDERGIDGGKLVKGRKRHIVVDILGNLFSIVVHAANIHDTKSGINPAKKAFEKYPTVKKSCSDEGYRKSFEEDIQSELELSVDISEKIKLGWAIIAKRWIVERYFCLVGVFTPTF